MLQFAVTQNYPIAIRYPRGGDEEYGELSPMTFFRKGRWEILNERSGKVALVATGKMVQSAIKVKSLLKENGVEATLINACFVKPIDKFLLKDLIKSGYKIVTIEDNLLLGGLGSCINEYLIEEGLVNNNILNLGFNDRFITHGEVDILYKENGLDPESICERILHFID